jgi:hypothetical protein
VGKEMLSGAELKRNMGGKTRLVKDVCDRARKSRCTARGIWAGPNGGENGDNRERGCIVIAVTFHSSNRAKRTTLEYRPC